MGIFIELPTESEKLVVNFARVMRNRLIILAGKIGDIRTENLHKAKGIPTTAENMT
ncbi:hypothetical protein BGZ98_001950, partial [Dissophora globulifera]